MLTVDRSTIAQAVVDVVHISGNEAGTVHCPCRFSIYLSEE